MWNPDPILCFIEAFSLALGQWSEREHKEWEAEMYEDWLARQSVLG